MTAAPGETTSLTCKATDGKSIIVVEWNRADLGEDYVLLYRDEQMDPYQQHQSFKKRVDLQDRKLKDGDVTLVLTNVETHDDGTYRCLVQNKGSLEKKTICVIHLKVAPPPPPPPTTASLSGNRTGSDKGGGNENRSPALIVGLLSVHSLLLVMF